MKKRVLAIFLSALMAFQIAGCGNNKKDTKNNNKNKVESTENEELFYHESLKDYIDKKYFEE